MRATGNDNVIKLLEFYLQQVRANGDWSAITIIMANCRNEVAVPDVAGCAAQFASLLGGCELAGNAVKRLLKTMSLPEVERNLTADYVCFNVPGGSLSFDFLPWLIDAEMTRVREGAPAPLKIGFWLGDKAGAHGFESEPARRRMFEKVLVPALDLIGAVQDEKARLNGLVKEFYTCRDIVGGCLAGEDVPRFAAPEHAKKLTAPYKGYVTITLREAAYWQHRNSNLEAWQRFARDLIRRGEKVVFVRDTANANKPLGDFPTLPAASYNLDFRMALYEQAKCNLFVSNGPIGLALFSRVPFLAFINTEPDGSMYVADTADFWRTFQGIEVGSQFPWSAPDQRIVWAKDDYENLIVAWNETWGLERMAS
jgi:hypothetical protein